MLFSLKYKAAVEPGLQNCGPCRRVATQPLSPRIRKGTRSKVSCWQAHAAISSEKTYPFPPCANDHVAYTIIAYTITTKLSFVCRFASAHTPCTSRSLLIDILEKTIVSSRQDKAAA